MKTRLAIVDKVTCRAGHTIEADPRTHGADCFYSEIVEHYMAQHKMGLERAVHATAALVTKAELAL